MVVGGWEPIKLVSEDNAWMDALFFFSPEGKQNIDERQRIIGSEN